VFSHGPLWSIRPFDPQVAALRDRDGGVAYDQRGQERSDVPPGRGAVTIEQCYADAVALLERLALGPGVGGRTVSGPRSGCPESDTAVPRPHTPARASGRV